jgi:hypothetical protein
MLAPLVRLLRAVLGRMRDAALRMKGGEHHSLGGTAERPVRDDLPGLAWRNVRVSPGRPVLDVLIPGLQMKHLSGGPNTALNLTYRLAAAGLPVRFISTDLPPDDVEALLGHCSELTGIKQRPADVSVASMHDRRRQAVVARSDVLFATAWWTAHYADALVREMCANQFVYMIQDFEPGFYKWSTEYALAVDTYDMQTRPVICGQLLAEYLREVKTGRFADPQFADSCLVFEPAIDRSRFHPRSRRHPDGPRRLLFYARPDTPRNLFEMGLLALRQAVDRGAITAAEWELWFIGGKVLPRDLGRGVVIRQHPWLDYDRYAALLRSCDVGLSLMLSPHTSYPPLEMAACGASVVTNTFANKTADRLRSYSQNLLPVDPSVASIAAGVVEAVTRTPDITARKEGSSLNVPATWDDAFAPVISPLVDMWKEHVARVNALGTSR